MLFVCQKCTKMHSFTRNTLKIFWGNAKPPPETLALYSLRRLWRRRFDSGAPSEWPRPSPLMPPHYFFLANVNVLRYVCYMLSAVRLSSVCLSSVTLVHPTQAVELFGNFFLPYDSPGTLVF